MLAHAGVPPFGDLRIKACVPLPEAYRSLPRPSSPDDAKAFTKCPNLFAVINIQNLGAWITQKIK